MASTVVMTSLSELFDVIFALFCLASASIFLPIIIFGSWALVNLL